MILIKKIEVIHTESSLEELCIIKGSKFVSETALDRKITEDMVSGRIFTNDREEKICIGMTKEVQELIGLPFVTFNNLQKKLKAYGKCFEELTKTQEEIRNLTFWQRIGKVFSGFDSLITYEFKEGDYSFEDYTSQAK